MPPYFGDKTMKAIERRVFALEAARPAPAVQRRSLDDFYSDLSQPDSDGAKALDAMYRLEATHDASH